MTLKNLLEGSCRDIIQIGIMTDDFFGTLDQLIDKYGLGPWDTYIHSEETLQGPIIKEGYCDPHFKFHCGVAMMGNIQLEVIQPVYGVPFYSSFLEKNGPGLHHIKEKVAPEKFDAVIEKYAEMGMPPIFGARLFESRFTFVDTLGTLGFQLEIGNGRSPSSVPAELKKVYTRK